MTNSFLLLFYLLQICPSFLMGRTRISKLSKLTLGTYGMSGTLVDIVRYYLVSPLSHFVQLAKNLIRKVFCLKNWPTQAV